MRFETRAIYVFPLLTVAMLCCAQRAHAGMSDWMDRMFTFREEQKPLLTPHGRTVPSMVKQPYYDSTNHEAWSTYYTRPDLEPDDYLSSSASKVMRPPAGSADADMGGWESINARGQANAAAASSANIAIGDPGQGPGMIGGDAQVGRKTIIGEAVRDWREDDNGGALRSRPGDYDYRSPNLNRPAKTDNNAVIGEPLADSRSAMKERGVKIEPPAALRNDPRYTDFNDQGQVTEYKVQKGDTISSIAEQGPVYGKKTLWPLIYSANRKVIGNSPKNLKIGQKLVIPRDYSDAQAKQAEKKAGKLK